ncbi:MAG: type VI secretion system contractile sheath small subunit [Campylobacterota bacterium]|nr:type VI secretion system contractile sheath small subunit [Campylobacterota bacterium]
MGKDSSVAPKERVNIVYKPDTGDQKEEVELPLKMLVMGDFIGREDDKNLEERKAINIDKDNFNDVMEGQGLSVEMNVPNHLSEVKDDEERGNLSTTLNFKKMRDFEPDTIAKEVPELKKLLDLRDALSALKGPLGNVPEFRKLIQTLVKDDASRDTLLKELKLDEEE